MFTGAAWGARDVLSWESSSKTAPPIWIRWKMIA